MKMYFVSKFMVDDMEHDFTDEHFHFASESDARQKFKDLVTSALNDIIDDRLWMDCNEEGYESVEDIIDEYGINLDTDPAFEWSDGCGYNELVISIEEIEIQ